MKKIFISALVLFAGLSLSARSLEVSSIEKVALPEGMIVTVPTISPDGSFVVVSDASGNALTKIDLSNGAAKVITKNGIGYDVAITADGQNVIFRETTTGKNKLRYTALKSVNLENGKTEVLVKPSRKLNTGVAVKGATVSAVENGKMKTRSLNGASVEKAPVVSINYGHLDVTVNGKTTSIDPQGRGSYLWPALSPDGTKVVYYLAGRGCFVCNLDGSNAKSLGLLRAAKWLDNETVVGMNDIDNGEYVLSSSIIASDLEGNRQSLTENGIIAMYPSASVDGQRIAFSTPAGELYIINLK